MSIEQTVGAVLDGDEQAWEAWYEHAAEAGFLDELLTAWIKTDEGGQALRRWAESVEREQREAA